MFRLFGAAKQAPSPSDTIKKLRETVVILEKREEYLQKKIQKEVDFARQNASKNRRGVFVSERVDDCCVLNERSIRFSSST